MNNIPDYYVIIAYTMMKLLFKPEIREHTKTNLK